MKDYFYELKYKNGENEATYKFEADLDIYKLQEHLERFLLSCSWDKEVLGDIFNDMEADLEHDIEEPKCEED